MGMNELEFQWRLNWWYRPTQCDGFGKSVTDYYECFCDWKDSMAINSCPADEADYVDAFIQNLKPDIRLRLESKVRSSTRRRLGDALYDAKLEESLISIDEALKKIKDKFEAPKLFDKLPSQVDSCLLTNSADSCSNKLAENLSDDKFSGLEYDESLQIELDKETHKMLGNLPEQNLRESSSIDQESNGDYDVKFVSPNAAAYPVFDGLPQMALTDTTYKLIDDSELNSQEATCNQDFGNVESDEQIEAESRKIISPNADVKVPDELPKPALTETASYMWIDEELDVHYTLNSQAGPTFDQVLGNSEDESLKLLNKSSELEFTGLKSFRKGLNSISTVNDGIQLMDTTMEFVQVVLQVFAEMPDLFSVKPHKEIQGNKSSIPLIDCVPKVFDPGDGVETVALIGWRFDEMSKESSIKMDSASTWLHTFDIMPIHISLEQPKGNGEALMTVFDPGGIPLYYKGFSSLKPNSVMQNLNFRLNESYSISRVCGTI